MKTKAALLALPILLNVSPLLAEDTDLQLTYDLMKVEERYVGIENHMQNLLKLVEQKHYPSMYELARHLEKNGIVLENYTPTQLIESASAGGYLPAMLTQLRSIEARVPYSDLVANTEWLDLTRLTAEQGDENSLFNFATLTLVDNIDHSGYQRAAAINLLENSIKSGNNEASTFLGNHFLFFTDTTDDNNAGIKYLMKSAASGDASATNNLAYFLSENNGDLEMARKLSLMSISIAPEPMYLDTLAGLNTAWEI